MASSMFLLPRFLPSLGPPQFLHADRSVDPMTYCLCRNIDIAYAHLFVVFATCETYRDLSLTIHSGYCKHISTILGTGMPAHTIPETLTKTQALENKITGPRTAAFVTAYSSARKDAVSGKAVKVCLVTLVSSAIIVSLLSPSNVSYACRSHIFLIKLVPLYVRIHPSRI